MQAKRVVATGFATIDYSVQLKAPFTGTGTVEMTSCGGEAWPRPGGAALYASRQLAEAGFDAAAITWIGGDADGDRYRAACRESNVRTQGLVVDDSAATAVCMLIYQPNGDYACLFRPGGGQPETLNAVQRGLLEEADLVVIAVGPPAPSNDVLSHIRPDAMVAWIAKTDFTSNSPALRAQYAARANYIFCNDGERNFVDASFAVPRRDHQVIIETRGSREVTVDSHGRQLVIPVKPLDTPDTTGAGDTLAGATLAQVLAGQTNPEIAVTAGIRAAASLLAGRAAGLHS